MTRTLRATGWTLILAGLVILLYVVCSLFFTSTTTRAAQAAMLDEWITEVGSVDKAAALPEPPADEDERPADEPVVAPPDGGEEADGPGDGGSSGDGEGHPDAVEPGDAVAVLQFHRPGASPPVSADPLFVVEGVTLGNLARGPGRYPQSSLPGEDGNFAVAGHRTTYGAPFFRLDELQAGDEVHVTDRSGGRHVYRFVERRVVTPNDVWVVGPDPLGNGAPLLTLTTCHPRFSARERLIVFAELVS